MKNKDPEVTEDSLRKYFFPQNHRFTEKNRTKILEEYPYADNEAILQIAELRNDPYGRSREKYPRREAEIAGKLTADSPHMTKSELDAVITKLKDKSESAGNMTLKERDDLWNI